MRLFLARHGETVDNVAGIYAGTRDSPLTAHGVLQARRLGLHLAERSAGAGTHVFASDLKRARETAREVVDALSTMPAAVASVGGVGVGVVADDPGGEGTGGGGDGVGADGPGKLPPSLPLRVVTLPELRERDFGLAEGKKFGVDLASAGAESKEQIRLRAERFVAGHLEPLLTAERIAAGGCVVVVAHGLILDSLLRVLLARFGPRELARLGKMPGWSNTGYVELVVGVGSAQAAVVDGPPWNLAAVSGERTLTQGPPTPGPSTPTPQQPQITLSVVGVNIIKHLEGLKKTRGGIGSAQFDKRQRTVDSFFGPAAKKARLDRGPGNG